MDTKKKKNKSTNPKIVVNPNMKDYSQEPFFIKKAEDSKKFIKKNGLPKNMQAK